MKTIAPAAMAAIEAGEAIVTGAAEIVPLARVSVVYSPFATIDLNAVANASLTKAGGLSVGVSLAGLDPSDTLRFTMPAGGTYTAWNCDTVTPPGTHFTNAFDVILDGDTSRSYRIDQSGIASSSTVHAGPYTTAAAARAAFVPQSISGASAYCFYILDSPITDNSGGVSIAVERGVLDFAGVIPPPPLRLWGGFGPIEFNTDSGIQAFGGVGNSAIVRQTAGAIGGVAQGITAGLSGIEPATLALLDDAGDFRAASVVVYRLIFASDGKTLLDAHVFDRGRMDTLVSDETVGKDAAIMALIESAARGLGRSLARSRSDADQRLINTLDGYFRNTGYAPEKKLYWGGKRPAVA